MRLTPDRARVQIAATAPGAQITDNEFERWLAAHEAKVRERIDQNIEAAASMDLALGLHGAIDIARGIAR